MYKQLWEREILKQPPGILSSLSYGSTNFRGSMVHADSADSGPLDDDEDDNLEEEGGKAPGSSVVICNDRGNEPVVGVEDVPAGSHREEGVSVSESDSGDGTEKSSRGEEVKGVVSAEVVEEEVLTSILADVNYGALAWKGLFAYLGTKFEGDMKPEAGLNEGPIVAPCTVPQRIHG